jgi:hypothetical protein
MLIAVVVFVICGAATVGPVARAQAPAKPVISAKIGEKTFKGTAGSTCWADDTGKPQCDLVDDPAPTAEIAWSGDPITFIVEPAVAKIDQFQVALLDNRAANGDPLTVDILVTNGVFTPPPGIKPGKQRIQVELFTNNKDYFVFYAFLVNYTGAGAAPTAVAANPTQAENATMAATMPSTAAATESAAGAGTQAATAALPPAPTMAATKEPAPATAPATAASMETTTVVAATAATTMSGTMAPTENAAATATPAMAVTVTPVATATNTPTTAPTVVPPSATPAGPTPTPAPPTATFAIAPNASVPAPDSLFPAAILVIGSTEYKPIAIEGCQIKPDTGRTCISGAVNSTPALADGKTGADTLFVFKGTSPSVVKLTTRGADGIKILSTETPTPGNVILSTLPNTAGTYILTLEVTFDGGQVTYFYRVVVS